MSTETLMTETAPNTNDGQAASQDADASNVAASPAEVSAPEANAQTQQPTSEKKPEDAPAVPEKYDFKAPEGKDFDPDVISAYSEIAKELKLPQESAQKIIDKIAPVMAEKQQRVMQQAFAEWGEAAKTDKEYGGEKFNENLAVARTAMKEFGTPELTKLLNDSGLGNHPELIRFMVRAGKAISEDGFVAGGRKTVETDPAKRLFPNQA